MNVCFISFEYPPNIIGGAGVYAETLVSGLRKSGVDISIITRGNGNDYDQQTFRIPTPEMSYWRRFFFIKPALRLLRELDKRLKFDLVHLNEPHIILGKINLPEICTFHSTQINEIRLKLPTLRRLKTVGTIQDLVLKGSVGTVCDVLTAHATDRIICPSPHLANLIASYCFFDREKIHVVPNGFDLEAFDKIETCSSHVFLDKYDLERDNYVLFMGRLSYLKGTHLLIEAFRTIKKEYPNLKLVISGTGDSDDYRRNLMHVHSNDVVFTGFVESLTFKKILYENCLGVVVPSLYEGLPMVILEAMASKKAVVASDVGGIPMLIRHGKSGFLAKPGDSRSLEKFIRILLEDPNLREKMGLLGRKLAEKKFTVDKMACETVRVYKSLVQSPETCV